MSEGQLANSRDAAAPTPGPTAPSHPRSHHPLRSQAWFDKPDLYSWLRRAAFRAEGFGPASFQGRPIIGEDSVKWAEIFQACEDVGGTEWYTIEQERYLPDTSPMDCVKLSLAGMKAILAQG